MYNLRYFILIFIFSIILLFTTPKLFKYVNKINILNNVLKNQHGLIIKKADKVKYKIFPRPHLEIRDSTISIGKKFINVKAKELKIYTNIRSLYFSDQIFLKKIKFKGSYLGNDISGYYIPKSKINFLFLRFDDLGIESKFFLNNKKKLPNTAGQIKLKILDKNLLINFDYDKYLKFENSVYISRNIHTKLSGKLDFSPFFYFNISSDIKKINFENLKLKLLYQFIVNELSNNKLNGELYIHYLTKKVIGKNKKKFNKINLNFNNGDIISNNSTLNFANLNIKINFYLKRYHTYKNLEYELFIETKNINKFFKIIDVKEDKNIKEIKALIKGTINLDAQKYYFDKVMIDKKNIQKKQLLKLKDFFDKNSINYFSDGLMKKNVYLFLKDLIEFI